MLESFSTTGYPTAGVSVCALLLLVPPPMPALGPVQAAGTRSAGMPAGATRMEAMPSSCG